MSVKEEEYNENDIFAVSVEKVGMTVGHVPHEVSRLLTFFIRHGGTTICEVTGHRRLGKTAWIDHATIWEGPASLCHIRLI